MRSHGAKNPRVLVIGEAPGRNEDADGFPFVGMSGKKLKQALQAAGFDVVNEVRFTNVVHCRPPENKITRKAVNYCKENVLAEIDHYDPELVLLCGNIPLSIVGETGITQWNGVIINRDGRNYVPLFHPAAILRDQSKMDDWLDGMLTAVDLLDGTVEQQEDTPIEIIDTIQGVYDMWDHLQEHTRIAFDLETSTLNAFEAENGYEPRIIVMSFASQEKAFAFPFDHDEATWSDIEREDIVRLVGSILEEHNGNVVGHNIKFDQVHLRQQLGIEFEAGGDTMVMSHLIDSRRGIHSLKRLAGIHLGMYGYDDVLEAYKSANRDANPYTGGSYANIPLETLLPYAALDVVATIRLDSFLWEKLSDAQKVLYTQMLIPASNALARMEFTGTALDHHIANRYHAIYSIVRDRVYDRIMQYREVQKLISNSQRDGDAALMAEMLGSTEASYGRLKKSFRIGDTKIEYIGNVDIGRRKRVRTRRIFEFNPNSTTQLIELYFGKSYCRLPVIAKTDTGLPSTRADAMKQYEAGVPLVKDIRYYKLLIKMIGTYLGPAKDMKWGRDRARCTFNLHGTVTGRLSSSDPNMQNIPTPEKEPGTLLETLPIKNIFTHSWGDGNGVIMTVDYSGMELRVFASLADCEPMLEIHRSGVDFHKMVASMASGIPYDDIDKPTRYVYKWTNWTLLYGGSAYTLHNLYGMPLEEAEDVVDTYYEKFPEVPEFLKTCVNFAIDHGYVESPFGRREHLPYIEDQDRGKAAKSRRSAVNMPVQSAASDVLLTALVIIDYYLDYYKLQAKLVNTVHDSIMLDVPNDEIDRVACICVEIMENIVLYAKRFMPGIDLSWLKSPLKADVEIGSHYGTEEGYEVKHDWATYYGLRQDWDEELPF